MIQKYEIATPEQLREIAVYCQAGHSALNMARVWSVTLRKKGFSPWDGKVGVKFETKGRERSAFVYRMVGNDERPVANIRYIAGVQYCREHLKHIITIN